MHAGGQLPVDRLVDYDDDRHDLQVRIVLPGANPGNNTRYNADD
jgi:hypothetical protein